MPQLFIALLLAIMASIPSGYALAADMTSGRITLGGTVEKLGRDRFILSYGDGSLTIDLGDWAWYRSGSYLRRGDKVILSGPFNGHLFEQAVLHADRIFVESANIYFYRDGGDEAAIALTKTGSSVVISGHVTDIESRVATIGTENERLALDVSLMSNDPFDDQGMPKIRIGDRVSAMGSMDRQLLRDRRLEVSQIIKLSRGANRD